MTDSQPGPWTVAEQPGNCSMCGARFEPGAQVMHDPNAGGLVDAVRGQDEPVPGILDQFLGDQEDASPQ